MSVHRSDCASGLDWLREDFPSRNSLCILKGLEAQVWVVRPRSITPFPCFMSTGWSDWMGLDCPSDLWEFVLRSLSCTHYILDLTMQGPWLRKTHSFRNLFFIPNRKTYWGKSIFFIAHCSAGFILMDLTLFPQSEPTDLDNRDRTWLNLSKICFTLNEWSALWI